MRRQQRARYRQTQKWRDRDEIAPLAPSSECVVLEGNTTGPRRHSRQSAAVHQAPANLTKLKIALLERACEIACLSEVIAGLPEGLDTIVGERGHSLSGGQRQRVGIARAICRNAPILLLDEATSALDLTTEQMVMEGLMADQSVKRTMLIVSHRTSTLKNVDRVVVFDQGQLVDNLSLSLEVRL